MWNRRKDEEQAPRGSGPSYATPVESAREGIPVSPMPSRVSDDFSRAATVGKSVSIKGQIFSREDLVIEGEVDGSIELPEHRVTIGPHGRLNAAIRAREIVVLGSIVGNVEATDKIDIRKDARLVGDIKTARIIIEDGAYFKGSIDIIKEEPARVAPKAQPPAAPPVQASSPAPASSVQAAAGGKPVR
ncbi:MAG: polymer-forming cytoskeletal protein [Bryobacterales bacterium]|nr:polymer-forming cytoskeletal protein [Bryobacterales bacterium]